MEINEVINMGDKILSRLTEDAAGVGPKKPNDPLAVKTTKAEGSNDLVKPLKTSVDSNRQKELSLEASLKETKQAMAFVTDHATLDKMKTSEDNIKSKIANLVAERKQTRNQISSLVKESADISSPKEKEEPEESDEDIKKDAAEFDKDIKESAGIDESMDSEVNKAKANAVIKACENEKSKLKSAENAKIESIKDATDRRVETISQKEEAAKSIKEKSQTVEITDAEKKQTQSQANQAQEQESMEQNDDGSAQIQEAFENIRSSIIHSKISRLTSKANDIKTKIDKGVDPKKEERLRKKLSEINDKLIKLTGSDLDGNSQKDFDSTPYGKLNRDINSKDFKNDKKMKTESLFVDDGIDTLIEECDEILNEVDDPHEAKKEAKAEEKADLTGLAKRIYDYCNGNGGAEDGAFKAACDALMASPDGKSTLAKISAELAKPEPSKQKLTLLKADIERIYGYSEKQLSGK